MRTVLFGLLLAVVAGSAQAEAYTIGVEAHDYYPQYRSDGANNFSGFARSVLDAFAADAGLQFKYRALAIPRLYAELVGGGIDFKYPDSPAWGLATKGATRIVYSQSVAAYTDGLLVRRERADGKGIRVIGTVAGFTPVAYQDALAAGTYTLQERGSLTALLLAVISGRVDAAYVEVSVGRHALKAIGGEKDVVYASSLPSDHGEFRLSTRKHAEVIARLDAWLLANEVRVADLRREFGIEP